MGLESGIRQIVSEMKFHLLLVCVAISLGPLPQSEAGVTEEQMWSAGKLMRDVCLPKYPKVSVEVADNIRNGHTYPIARTPTATSIASWK
ncbi:GD24882 [Drosophila simulans]|uniref:GD24882 n=1 Tax=Drosophila simulans TaxID=7240 RepID=B4NUT5_DROSI|nr:GD24882 [Drosophila simulans]